MLGGLVKAGLTYVGSATAVSALRKRGILQVYTAKIDQPLIRSAADYYLRVGDASLAFIEKQTKDVFK